MELITVKESLQGKYGPQLKDEKGFLSFGKFYTGKKEFAPGAVLEVDIYTTAKGGRYINKLNVPPAVAPVQDVKVVSSIPKTEVEKATKQTRSVKAVAFGRELSDYELAKDRRIGVAGVTQAVIGSEWYAQQAALTDLSNKDSVKALRDFAQEEVEYWLGVIKAKSE